MIYKYQLKVTDSQELELPKGARILTVQTQQEVVCLWALVDSNAIERQRHVIHFIGTGNSHIPSSKLRYIGTVQQLGGSLVWHVFEEFLD
jgi:hypothetical protein